MLVLLQSLMGLALVLAGFLIGCIVALVMRHRLTNRFSKLFHNP